MECAHGGVSALIRVSGHWRDDGDRSRGSVAFQRAQLKHVRRWGIDPESVRIFEFLGHSAQRDAHRTHVRELLEHVRSGQTKMLMLGWTSRLARGSDGTLEMLFEALKEARGGIFVQGRFLDLLDYEDAHRLREQILAAERENDERARLAALGRYELAKDQRLLVPLPTGLVWADPDDLSFRMAVESAGLEGKISPEALTRHTAWVERDGRRFYVFPDPREKCWRAVEYILNAVRSTRSITGALEAVLHASADDYPRPGYLPTVRRAAFKSEGIEWKRIRGRADGRDDAPFARIRDMVHSPALYGVYSYVPRKLLPIAHILPEGVQEVWIPGAFPGLVPVEAYESTIRAVRDPERRNIRRNPNVGARRNLVARVHCSFPLPSGKPCGLAHVATNPSPSGGHTYVCSACSKRGHAGIFPGSIDDAIQQIVLHSFNEDQAEREFQITLEKGSELDAELQKAQAELADAFDLKEYAKNQAHGASGRSDTKSELDWLATHRKALESISGHERRVSDLKHRKEQVEQMGERERGAILALANDFPSLLQAARLHDGLGRMLLDPLIEQVRVRRLGTGIQWVEATFPGGSTSGRIHLSSNCVPATPFMRAVAHTVLKPFLSPESRATPDGEKAALGEANALASKWNSLLGARPGGARWDAEDVLSVAYQFDRTVDIITGDSARSLRECAKAWGRSPREVEVAALRGRLGPPAVIGPGDLRISPPAGAVEAAFPEVRVIRNQAEITPCLTRLGDHAVRHDLNPRKLLSACEAAGVVISDERGVKWIPLAVLEELSSSEMGVLEGEGWFRVKDLEIRLPGVRRKALERIAISAWPAGLGPQLRGDRWFWIDATVEEELRQVTVEEWLELHGLESRTQEVRRRTELRKRLRAQAGFGLTDTMLHHATQKGRIITFSAASEPYGPRIQWVIVPSTVWKATVPEAVREWLRGAASPAAGAKD